MNRGCSSFQGLVACHEPSKPNWKTIGKTNVLNCVEFLAIEYLIAITELVDFKSFFAFNGL